jgi:phosphoglycolate phosphatase
MNSKKQISTIIFDFDGTIADSAEIFIESLAEVLHRPALTEAEAIELSNLSFFQVVQRLGVKKWQLPWVSYKGRKKILAKMDRVKIFDGIPEALKELSAKYDLYILTSNSDTAVRDFLDKYKVKIYFKNVYTGSSLAGKAKKLQKLLTKEKLDVKDCVYIGDETRDIEASKQIGMKCIAVGWGYSSRKALLSLKPDKFANTPTQLIKAINDIKTLRSKV